MKHGDINDELNTENFEDWLMSMMNELSVDPDFPQDIKKPEIKQDKKPIFGNKLVKLEVRLSIVKDFLYENYKSN